VNYALFGYVWIREDSSRTWEWAWLHQTVVIMLVWLVLCMTSLLGPVANVAHVVGLIVGVVAAYAPIEFRKLRRSLRS
jgi:GlpG protein